MVLSHREPFSTRKCEGVFVNVLTEGHGMDNDALFVHAVTMRGRVEKRREGKSPPVCAIMRRSDVLSRHKSAASQKAEITQESTSNISITNDLLLRPYLHAHAHV